MPAANNTPAPAVDLVAQAVKQGETHKKVATEPKTRRIGYGVFQVRATGAFAVLTYTPKGQAADWQLVGADRKTVLARGKRMKDVIATHDQLVTGGKIKPIATPAPAEKATQDA